MQNKTIDGLQVVSVSLEPSDAYDLLPELAPILGVVFAGQGAMRAVALASAVNAKAGGAGAGIDLASLPDVDIAGILQDAGRTLGNGVMTNLVIRLLKSTVIMTTGPEGSVKHTIRDRATLNLAFAGKMWSVFPVAAFAFEVTFGNFTDVVARLPGVTRAQ